MAMNKKVAGVLYYVLLGFGISLISGLLIGFGITGFLQIWIFDLGNLISFGLAAFATTLLLEKVFKLKKEKV